jgi:hypothetical protein
MGFAFWQSWLPPSNIVNIFLFAQAHGKRRKLPDGYFHPQRQLLTDLPFNEWSFILQAFFGYSGRRLTYSFEIYRLFLAA